MTNTISLHYSEDYKKENVRQAMNDCLNDLGGISSIIKPKSKVMLLCHLLPDTHPDEAKTTHPNIVSVLSEKLSRNGNSCVIFDYCENFKADREKIYETTHMLSASNDGFAELSHDDDLINKNVDGVQTKSLILTKLIDEVDYIINVPKLVTDESGLNCALKNLLGLIPGEQQLIIKNRCFTRETFSNYILDIYDEIKDKLVLNVVDGIVASESDGSQRILNLVLAGKDIFSVEKTILDILGSDYKMSTELALAELRNMFDSEDKIKLFGDSIYRFKKEDFRFDTDTEKGLSNRELNRAMKSYDRFQNRPKILVEKCKGCATCKKVCPNDAIEFIRDKNGELSASINKAKCINCMRCKLACPYSAITNITPQKYKNLAKRIAKRMKT